MKNNFHPEKREELQWYREHIDIRSYLESIGYAIDKSRNSKRYQAYFHEERGDKIYVPMDTRHPVPSYYVNQFDRKDKGSVVDFIMSREKKSLDEARLVLRAFSGGDFSPVSAGESGPEKRASAGQEAKEKLAEQLAEQQRKHGLVIEKILREKSLKDESYLRSRFLEEDTIRARAFKGKVLLNTAPDGAYIAFPLQEVAENKVTGISLKNAGGERMLGRRTGLWISHPARNSRAPVEQLVLTESPVDAMSYYQLRKKEVLQTNAVFVSTAGNPGKDQLKSVREFITLHKIPAVVLAHDNDKAGEKYNRDYLQLIREWNRERKENPVEVKVVVPVFKDFNADLKARKVLELRQPELRDLLRPEHGAGLHPLKEEPAKLLYEKNYKKLSEKDVLKELQQSFVEKEIDGRKARFSIRELALINNDKKLLALLDRGEEKSASSALLQESALPYSRPPELTRMKQKKEKQPATDRPPAGREASLNVDAGDQQLERAYFKTIRNLQLQIKDNPRFREMYQRLELYKKYPHLSEEEVDTYLGLMQRNSAANQLQRSVAKGKGKGLAGAETEV